MKKEETKTNGKEIFCPGHLLSYALISKASEIALPSVKEKIRAQSGN